MRAKYACQSVTDYGHNQEVKLSAVTAGEDQEDNQFNEATPYGELTMSIDNKDAFGFFKPGKNYYLDFTEVQES